MSTYNDSGSFVMNGQPVVVNSDTVLVNGSTDDLGLNAHLIVSGRVNEQGILEAAEISVRQSADSERNLQLQGTVETAQLATQSFRLLGSLVQVNQSTIILNYPDGTPNSANFTDILDGYRVQLAGRLLADNSILALRIDIEPPVAANPGQDDTDDPDTDQTDSPDVTITGTVTDYSRNLGTLEVGNHHITTGPHTRYFWARITPRHSSRHFYNLLRNSDPAVSVEVTGTDSGENWIQANTIRILTD
ncbi:MAG: DUF5666 domain-containing protein [Thiolinea sp.]